MGRGVRNTAAGNAVARWLQDRDGPVADRGSRKRKTRADARVPITRVRVKMGVLPVAVLGDYEAIERSARM